MLMIFLNLNVDNRIRGHDMKIRKLKCRLDLCKNFFSFRIVEKWKNLPRDIVHSPSLNCFKNRLDKFMDGWMNETNVEQ